MIKANVPRLTPSPLSNPSTPKCRLPAGSIDSHIHLFGPSDKFEFSLDSQYYSADATADIYFKLQDHLGLSKAVLVSGGAYGQSYDHLVATLQLYPERLKGVVRLPITVTSEDVRWLAKNGVCGARYFSRNFHQLTNELLDTFKEIGWHIQFYPDAGTLADHENWLLGLNCTVVLDHFAHNDSGSGVGSIANKCLGKLLENDRFWVKMSGPMRITEEEPPYQSVMPIAKWLVKTAPERLVWGSDWPHTLLWDRTMPDDGELVDLIADWIGDEQDIYRIMVENPTKLYGF